MIARAILAALVLLPMAAPVAAHQYTVGSLVIDHPWARATPPGARVAGGYLTITNRGVVFHLILRIQLQRFQYVAGALNLRTSS